MMKKKESIPIILVNMPIPFDFVQPDKEIIINKAIIPKNKVEVPIKLSKLIFEGLYLRGELSAVSM